MLDAAGKAGGEHSIAASASPRQVAVRMIWRSMPERLLPRLCRESDGHHTY
jgi:hypothetical protein